MVPMVREGRALGAIAVARSDLAGAPKPFLAEEIELLKTFAEQAVIAIENVRLFKELDARTAQLTRSVEELKALGEVSRAISSTLDIETVLNMIVSRASQLAGADRCSIYEYDEGAEQFNLRATDHYDAEYVEAPFGPRRCGRGRARGARCRSCVSLSRSPTSPSRGPIGQPSGYAHPARLPGAPIRAAAPQDQIIGSLSFNRKEPGDFTPEVIEVFETFATQRSALAILNARLPRDRGQERPARERQPPQSSFSPTCRTSCARH
jgi:GAF domain-containing protein